MAKESNIPVVDVDIDVDEDNKVVCCDWSWGETTNASDRLTPDEGEEGEEEADEEDQEEDTGDELQHKCQEEGMKKAQEDENPVRILYYVIRWIN